ncbi:MAG: hypothetical protein QMD36_03285 [Candidatus Aenigmarchaeota archaeon]|nr:hypothetical protein [Candidatus Aenigmarchaeota archaeon]
MSLLKKFALVFIFFLLVPIVQSIPICTHETDGGNEPKIPGSISIFETTLKDDCRDSKTLNEYYCLSDRASVIETYDCTEVCNSRHAICVLNKRDEGYCYCSILPLNLINVLTSPVFVVIVFGMITVMVYATFVLIRERMFVSRS